VDDRRISIDELRQQQQDNWPEMHAASKPALLRFLRLSDYVLREGARTLQQVNLLSAEFDVLAALRRQPPPHTISPTELCRALLISSGGLTKVLYRLQDQQLISRPNNPSDGRSLLVALTETGKQRVEAATVELMGLHHRQINMLDDAEQDTLNTLLEKMLQKAAERAATN
jgi:DNA-binding MarR family transcriptional regulator